MKTDKEQAAEFKKELLDLLEKHEVSLSMEDEYGRELCKLIAFKRGIFSIQIFDKNGEVLEHK